MADFVNKIYPFTTESITGYIKEMDLKDKSVLTVGSSIDHALSACLYGSNDITLIDISKQTQDFLDYKLDAISKTNSPDELYKLITSTTKFVYDMDEIFGLNALKKMCPYMKDIETFQKLKELLKNVKFKFIEGNIFNMDEVLGDQTFDRILLSNAVQYSSSYVNKFNRFRSSSKFELPYKLVVIKTLDFKIQLRNFIRENFLTFVRHLNKDGILQLLYVYAYGSSIDLDEYGFNVKDIIIALRDYLLNIIEFENGNTIDAVLTYTKK